MNLFLFHSLTQDPVVNALFQFRESGGEETYYQIARALIDFAKTRKTKGNVIKEYVIKQVLESENLPYITELRDFLRCDIKAIFYELLEEDWDKMFRKEGFLPLSEICLASVTEEENPEYVRSLEMLMDCSSNEAMVGALLAHVESFFA